MKCIFVVITVAAYAVAELPPSNSYLPPSPSGRNAGYPQGPQPGPSFPGAPQVIAARNIEQGLGNGYSRSSSHDHSAQGRLSASGSQGYDDNSAAYARNAIDANAEPANYNFGYMVNDFNEGTDFGHHEERLEEKAQGQYHVVLPDGRKQTVNYEADERGFKPQVSYEDSEDLTHSEGYDGNANTRNHGNGYQSNGHDDARGY
ncbi:pro-resilin-like [Bicyclus anynana]|uniref:Pro-resilin-like n=1 Tax=Bicyclus anynana TaxID=110368 RepID=A0A6J1NGR8_BICAN|nr:pro-resilin-like [Bicyclus anynana]